MADTNKSALKWINAHYRHIIYCLLIIFGAIPYINPIGLPITIGYETLGFYNAIQNLPEGKTVLVIYNWGSGAWGELGGGAIALNSHLAQRHTKIVFISLGVEGPLILEKVISLQRGGREALGTYGVDWVNLGFIPGGENALAAIMTAPDGFHKAYADKDSYNNNFDSLPLMANVLDYTSIDLTVVLTTGGVVMAVRQIYTSYKIPIICASIGVDWPEIKMFIDSGQLLGGVASLRGSAEYEKLTGFLGSATSSIEALSFNHLLLIGLLVVGNIELLYSRGVKKQKKE